MNWQLSNSDIRWPISHNHFAASDKIPAVLPLHVSSVIYHIYRHKNETTLSPRSAVSSLKLYVQAKSRSIESCRNGTCADHYHKTNNVGSGTRFDISPPPTSRNEVSYTTLSYSQSIYSNIRHAYEGQLTALKQEHPLAFYLITGSILFF